MTTFFLMITFISIITCVKKIGYMSVTYYKLMFIVLIIL